MLVEAQVTIKRPRAVIWTAISDIQNFSTIVSGIQGIELLHVPTNGVVGLRWRETRVLFGKPATVAKQITDAVENEFYTTMAEDSGFLFITTMRLSTSSAGTTLTSSHHTKPQGVMAKLKAMPMFLFKGMIRQAILQDLNDIKAAVEGAHSRPA